MLDIYTGARSLLHWNTSIPSEVERPTPWLCYFALFHRGPRRRTIFLRSTPAQSLKETEDSGYLSIVDCEKSLFSPKIRGGGGGGGEKRKTENESGMFMPSTLA